MDPVCELAKTPPLALSPPLMHRMGFFLLMEGNEIRQVNVGQNIGMDHEERLMIKLIFNGFYRACCAKGLILRNIMNRRTVDAVFTENIAKGRFSTANQKKYPSNTMVGKMFKGYEDQFLLINGEKCRVGI